MVVVLIRVRVLQTCEAGVELAIHDEHGRDSLFNLSEVGHGLHLEVVVPQRALEGDVVELFVLIRF
tara:strand:+ start:2740 stop:2937 length:198 start_codon:yes stop_codon:yes gene_type:complete